MNDLYPCACCGERTTEGRSSYDICSVCGWQEDVVQNEDADYAGGANKLSLNEARANWNAKKIAS